MSTTKRSRSRSPSTTPVVGRKKSRTESLVRPEVSASVWELIRNYQAKYSCATVDDTLIHLLNRDCVESLGGEPDAGIEPNLVSKSNEKDEYLFVQRDKLIELFNQMICPICKQAYTYNSKLVDKSDHLLVVALRCVNGHQYKWYNSDLDTRTSAFKINVAIPSAFLLCGIGFSRYAEISKILKSGAIDKKRYYKNIQKQLVKPLVHNEYLIQQAAIFDSLKSRKIKLVFDARYDSPQRKSKQGFWCSMIFLDYATRKVIDVVHITRPRSATKSASREAQAFQIFMEKISSNLQVEEYIHDADNAVRGAIKKIKLQDQYEWSTNGPITKQIKKDFKPLCQKYSDLKDKASHLPKHWLKCLKSSHDHPNLFMARLFNCVSHWSGTHEYCKVLWPKSKCLQSEYKPKYELIRSDLAKMAVFNFIGKKLMDLDIEKYVRGHFTSPVEEFNRKILKYCPKTSFYNVSYPMRIELTVLDWNENVDNKARRTTFFRQIIFERILGDQLC